MFFLIEAGRATNGTAWKRAKERKTQKHENMESAPINQAHSSSLQYCMLQRKAGTFSSKQFWHSLFGWKVYSLLTGRTQISSEPQETSSKKCIWPHHGQDDRGHPPHLVPSTSFLWGAPYLWRLKREGTPVPTGPSSFGGTGVSPTFLLHVF